MNKILPAGILLPFLIFNLLTYHSDAALSVKVTSTNVTCVGGSNGIATATTTGGVIPYTYKWSDAQTTSIATGLSAGAYTITVTDASNASVTASVNITQPRFGITIRTTVTNISCFGESNGIITTRVMGGNPPYTYHWSNNESNANDSNLTAGSYTVTVNDTNGCTSSASASISEPPLLSVTISANVTACGNTLGAAATGGTTPYAYKWTGGLTSSTINNLSKGSYTVTVTDPNNCTASASVTITSAPAFSVTYTSTNVTCIGYSNGSAAIIASGGGMPYTYSWSPITNTTSSASGLSAGIYTITVTNLNGCKSVINITVTQPANGVTIRPPTITNVNCYGGSDGLITTRVMGGAPPYTYHWSNNESNANDSNLTAGSYTVTVNDTNGCTSSASASVTVPPLLSVTISANVTACGNTLGATASGGTTPYGYSWSGGQTTSTVSNLSIGSYTITIKDAHSCTTSASIAITEAPSFSITYTSSNIKCNGYSDGSATVIASGGTMPYTYSWSPITNTTSSVSGLSAGTYTASVTDSSGCKSSVAITITQPNFGMFIRTTATNAICYGSSNGIITTGIFGGAPPYTYQWSNNESNANDSNLVAGSYTVSVTDNSGCSSTASATVNQPTMLAAFVSATITACGNSCGATGSGGTAPYVYLWSGGQTTSSVSNLSIGTFTVTLTDSHGCSASAAVTISSAPAFSVSYASNNISCNGNSSGSITVIATGGGTPYTYSWSPNINTTSSASGLSAGTYVITVTDITGCKNAVTVTITQPESLRITMTATNLSCGGDTTGVATATVAGGTLPYTFLWSNGQKSSSDTDLIAGVYTVTLTDAHSCTLSASVATTQPPPLKDSVVSVASVCGSTTTAYVTGGTPNYRYSWSGGETSSSVSNFSLGTYTVTVIDRNSCTLTASVAVTNGPQLTLKIKRVDVSCNGGNDGSITVYASGGSQPFTYRWNNGATTSSLDNLVAARYRITVTDTNGCTATAQVTVTQPVALSEVSNLVNISCGGESNGSVAVTVSGGMEPYTYLWNIGATSSEIINLSAGIYSVAITDSNHCTLTVSITVTQPSILTVSAGANTEISCNGGSNGSATANVSGGTFPFMYSWNTSPVQTNQHATGMKAGNYEITVTDKNGCVATAQVTITQPPLLALSATLISNASCGNNNGSATANVSGGQSPYTYSWNTSPKQTSQKATGLSVGSYIVTIIDFNGCTGTVSVSIGESSSLSLTVTLNSNISCNGGTNGGATANPEGGSSPYTYSWSTTPVQTGKLAMGMSAGSYTLTVKDINGCIATAIVTITQPSALTTSISNITNANCGNNNGGASVNAAGGTSPYKYSWSTSPKQTSQQASGLSAGNYTVTITDNNGCTITATVSITSISSLTLSIALNTNVSCYGESNGSATASPNGGTSPYTYSWNTTPIQTGKQATGLIAGIYSVTVKDVNGCEAVATVSISQPSVLTSSANLVANANCGGNNGIASAGSSGGTSPYFYSWNTSPIQTNQQATGLSAGKYTVAITDNNGCTSISSVMVNTVTSFAITITVNSNVTCNKENGSVTATASGGNSPYTYSWSTQPAQTNAQATGLSAGAYSIIITDANGCVSTASVSITQSGNLVVNSKVTLANYCTIDNSSIAVTTTGGSSPYTFKWSDNKTTSTVTGLSAGIYTLTVTDNSGCSVTVKDTVSKASKKIQITFVVTPVVCNGGNSGASTVTAAGGVAPYTYLWNPTGQTTTKATGLSAGIYTVLITDINGCTNTNTVNINQPSKLVLDITGKNILCLGDADGSVRVVATGGNSPYTYKWNNGSTAANPLGLTAGSFSVSVTDGHRCNATASIAITQPLLSLYDSVVSVTNVSCYYASNGCISVGSKGGTQPYTYSWNTGATTTQVCNLTAGTYTAHVTDKNGCTALVEATITRPAVVTISITQTNVSCNGADNGSASASVAGGTSPYSYSWTTGSTNQRIAGLSKGNYTVTATDVNGCTASASIGITQPSQLHDSISISSCVNKTGTVSVGVKGGTSPYQYAWSPSGGTGANASGLTNDTYTIKVTDNNSCSATATVTITCASEEEIPNHNDGSVCCDVSENISNIVLYPNPNKGEFTLEGIEPGTVVELYNMLGQNIRTEISGKSSMKIDITSQPAGIYILRIISSTGQNFDIRKIVKE